MKNFYRSLKNILRLGYKSEHLQGGKIMERKIKQEVRGYRTKDGVGVNLVRV